MTTDPAVRAVEIALADLVVRGAGGLTEIARAAVEAARPIIEAEVRAKIDAVPYNLRAYGYGGTAARTAAAGNRLVELARKATPGPWKADGWVPGSTSTESYGVWAGNPDQPNDPIAKTSRLEQGWHDAQFIAAACNAVGAAVRTEPDARG